MEANGVEAFVNSAPLEDAQHGDRIKVLIARFLGVGFIAYLLVSVSGIAESAEILADWWTPVALFLVFVPGIALFVVTFVAPSAIPVATIAAVVGIPVASALWFLAWNGEALGAGARGSWLSAFAGLSGLCAALVWRPAVTLALQLTVCTAVAAIDQLGLFGRAAALSDVVYAAVWAFGFTALLTGAVIMALHTGAVLDATRELVERSAADTAAALARERERSRFDALIHDRVLTTLLATARPDADGRIVDDARSAIDELDLAAQDPEHGGQVSADRLLDRLSSIASGAREDVLLSVAADRTADSCSPAVASAVCGAAAEAVRNSIQHAGRCERSLVVDLRQDAVRVVVSDNGCGFDTAAVGLGRLGIEVSIVRRMAALHGGRSEIDSSPGEGTTVVIEWVRSS